MTAKPLPFRHRIARGGSMVCLQWMVVVAIKLDTLDAPIAFNCGFYLNQKCDHCNNCQLPQNARASAGTLGWLSSGMTLLATSSTPPPPASLSPTATPRPQTNSYCPCQRPPPPSSRVRWAEVPPPPGNTAPWATWYLDGAALPLPRQAEEVGGQSWSPCELGFITVWWGSPTSSVERPGTQHFSSLNGDLA